MMIFNCEIETSILDAAYAEAEADYPAESCGLILGCETQKRGTCFVPLRNHAGADSLHSFRVNELEYMNVVLKGRSTGLRPLAFFHSHPDASPCLSKRDLASHTIDGQLLFPGQIHVVASVVQGKRQSVQAYYYSPESQGIPGKENRLLSQFIEVSS